MRAQELRIGNWVSHKYANHGEPGSYWADCPFQLRHFYGIDSYPDNYKSIRLTEEWLLKLGAVKDEEDGMDDNYLLDAFNHCVRLSTGDVGVINEVDGKVTWICRVKYVHRLQNLYFELTGVEL